MLDKISTYINSVDQEYEYTVVIPSWNNLIYLQLCLEGLEKNSTLIHQIIVIVNEGNDGTIDWLKNRKADNLDILHFPDNIGICFALNAARTYLKSDYFLYMNDDMYPLPDWDNHLLSSIQSAGKMAMYSSTMVEPSESGNKAVVVADFGHDTESFKKDEIINNTHKLARGDWLGSTWPPNILHKDLWDLVGGMSIEFSPGFGSDPDLSMKLYKAGVRDFRGIGNSLVYHFGSKSTGKIKKNPGKELFELKWDIKRSYFTNSILKRGGSILQNTIEEDIHIDRSLAFKLRQIFSQLRK